MDVFDLVAKLTLDSSEYDKGLTGAEGKASSFGSKLKSGLGTAAKVGGVAIAAVGTAAVATGTAIVKATGDVAAYGDNIDKMSQKMGISAEAYQEWDAVMQHSGTSMESLKASMKTMASAAEKGNEAFAQLGITEEEVANLSQEDLFDRVISGLQNMEEGTERTYLASQLLGRGATELGALLNTSAEETQAMKDRVHELGGVMSDEAVKAAAAYQDTLQDMQTGFESLKRNLVSEFLPGITEVMSGLTDLTTGDFDAGGSKIASGIDNVISEITEKAPKFAEAGMSIIMAISDAIIENFPKLVETLFDLVGKLLEKLTSSEMLSKVGDMLSGLIEQIGKSLPPLIKALGPAIISLITTLLTDVIPGLAESILGALPQILEAVLELVVMLVEYIATDGIPMVINLVIDLVLKIIQMIPELITMLVGALPDLISGIISGILGNLPLFIIAGIELFLGLIKAIPQIIIAIVKVIPAIIKGIIDGFKQAWTQMQESGGDLFTNLIEGFKDFGSKIWDVVKLVWEAIKKAFTEKFNQMKDIGKNLLQGLIDGIKGMAGKVGDAVKNVASGITGGFKKLFGIASPSKLFEEYGNYIDEGLAIGIDRGTDGVDDAMDNLYGSVLDVPKVNGNVGLGLYGDGESGYNNLVGALVSALREVAPEFATNVNVTGNKDRIVDITVEANRDYRRMTGVGLYGI